MYNKLFNKNLLNKINLFRNFLEYRNITILKKRRIIIKYNKCIYPKRYCNIKEYIPNTIIE